MSYVIAKYTDKEDEIIPCENSVIPYEAFKNNTSLREVELPDGIKTISESAFEGCTSLTTVKFPETVQIIRWFAFYGCSALKQLILPDSLTRVDCWDARRVAKLTLRPSLSSMKMLIQHLVNNQGEVDFYYNGYEPDFWE